MFCEPLMTTGIGPVRVRVRVRVMDTDSDFGEVCSDRFLAKFTSRPFRFSYCCG